MEFRLIGVLKVSPPSLLFVIKKLLELMVGFIWLIKLMIIESLLLGFVFLYRLPLLDADDVLVLVVEVVTDGVIGVAIAMSGEVDEPKLWLNSTGTVNVTPPLELFVKKMLEVVILVIGLMFPFRVSTELELELLTLPVAVG